jgi:hypothetical protein
MYKYIYLKKFIHIIIDDDVEIMKNSRDITEPKQVDICKYTHICTYVYMCLYTYLLVFVRYDIWIHHIHM